MTRNRPLIFSAANSAAQFVLGMVSGQRGPSFNDLILISHTDVEGGSFFITATYFGYVVGSILAGTILGRIKTKSLTIAIASMFAGVFTSLIPQCPAFPAMLVMHSLVAVCIGAYENTVYVEEIQAWGGSSESALQFLSFCFSVGGMIAPLITQPFLAPKVTHDKTDSEDALPILSDLNYSIPDETSVLSTNGGLKVNRSSDIPCLGMLPDCTNSFGNKLAYNMSTRQNSSNQTLASDDVTSNLQYAYIITGAANILLSITFYAMCAHSISRTRATTKRGQAPLPAKRVVPRTTFVKVMALVGAYFFFHTMGVDSFAQYLFYFAVTRLDWSKENSAYLISLFWALGIPVKLILVVIYKRVKVGTVLLFSITGMVISVVLFVVAGQFHIHALLWVSCSGVAVSHAAIFGGGFAWADGNLIPLDGKVISVLMVLSCIGALSAPPPLGALMKNWSLMALPYFVLIQVSISGTIFLIMSHVVKPAMDRTYGPVRPHVEHNVVSEGDVVMTPMVPSEDGSKTGMST